MKRHIHPVRHEVEDCLAAAMPVVALDNVSILAAFEIMQMRKTAIQERSALFQHFSRQSCYDPQDSDHTYEATSLYGQAMDLLSGAYEKLEPLMQDWADTQIPQGIENRQAVVRAKARDSLRGLIPLGALTQLSLQMPVDDYRQVIWELHVGSDPERMAVAGELLEALQGRVPPAADQPEWFSYADAVLRAGWEDEPACTEPRPWSVCLEARGTEEDCLAQLAYRHSGVPLRECWEWVRGCPADAWKMFDDCFSVRKTRYDPVPRELEVVNYRSDIVMDIGAFWDLSGQALKQPFGVSLGFQIPECPEELNDAFEMPLMLAGELAARLQRMGSSLFRYCIPVAYNCRATIDQNACQLYGMSEIGTDPGLPTSYRRVVEEMARQARVFHPRLLGHMFGTSTTLARIG